MNKVKINFYIKKFLNEWLLISTIIGVITTSVILKRIPLYSKNDFEILFILFMLFVIIKGLENSNFFEIISNQIKNIKFFGVWIILITAILSMFITNDVALLIIVPLTLQLNVKNKNLLIILEALAVNAGSALSPFGNPQNIFIYWFYNVKFFKFLKTIFPFTAFSLLLLLIISSFINFQQIKIVNVTRKLKKEFYIYLVFLIIFILIIFRILPVYTGIIPLVYTILFSRKNLKIDYILILIFFFFFGFTDNLKNLINLKIENSHNVFILSALISQFLSNVPTALLFSDFTKNWQALLWGVNVGGYGTIIGSLANLIAYRFYMNFKEDKTFFLKFNLFSFLFYFFNIIFYLRFLS